MNVADLLLAWFFQKRRKLKWKNKFRDGATTTSKAQYILLLISNILLGKEHTLEMFFV